MDTPSVIFNHKFAFQPCGLEIIHLCHDMGSLFFPFCYARFAWERGTIVDESSIIGNPTNKNHVYIVFLK